MQENIFLLAGYFMHDISFLILIWAMFSNKSAEGVSLITQALYIIVFCTRYIDLFEDSTLNSAMMFIHKTYYILASAFIVFLMTKVYPRTREREQAWKLGAACLGGAIVASWPVTLLGKGFGRTGFKEIMFTLSIVLESVCILPQLLLLRQTTVPTVIDSYYLLTLGLYRALYIPNWIYKAINPNSYSPDGISVFFGIVQTVLYCDFAWVYWTRQRVKLRSGGVVDSDDIRRGWLIGSVLNNRRAVGDDDDDAVDAIEGGVGGEESEAFLSGGDANAGTKSASTAGNKWGPRGISVSADDTLPEIRRDDGFREANGNDSGKGGGSVEGITDPNDFEDDDEEDTRDNGKAIKGGAGA